MGKKTIKQLLRDLLAAVHPDRFIDRPEVAYINEESLKKLMVFMDELQRSYLNPQGKSYDFHFFLWEDGNIREFKKTLFIERSSFLNREKIVKDLLKEILKLSQEPEEEPITDETLSSRELLTWLETHIAEVFREAKRVEVLRRRIKEKEEFLKKNVGIYPMNLLAKKEDYEKCLNRMIKDRKGFLSLPIKDFMIGIKEKNSPYEYLSEKSFCIPTNYTIEEIKAFLKENLLPDGTFPVTRAKKECESLKSRLEKDFGFLICYERTEYFIEKSLRGLRNLALAAEEFESKQELKDLKVYVADRFEISPSGWIYFSYNSSPEEIKAFLKENLCKAKDLAKRYTELQKEADDICKELYSTLRIHLILRDYNVSQENFVEALKRFKQCVPLLKRFCWEGVVIWIGNEYKRRGEESIEIRWDFSVDELMLGLSSTNIAALKNTNS